MAGAAAALYGPLHGGANEAVLNMLGQIGDKKNIPELIKRVKAGEFRLMGFGHRVYKNYDPRARIIKQAAEMVFDVVGRNPLIDTALELERIALEDDYFVSRKLYPNVDFYSGIIYQAMNLPVQHVPGDVRHPRTIGWLAQWNEMVTDPEQKDRAPTSGVLFAVIRARSFPKPSLPRAQNSVTAPGVASTLLKQQPSFLTAMLSPRSVALIGASETSGSVGRALMENL